MIQALRSRIATGLLHLARVVNPPRVVSVQLVPHGFCNSAATE